MYLSKKMRMNDLTARPYAPKRRSGEPAALVVFAAGLGLMLLGAAAGSWLAMV